MSIAAFNLRVIMAEAAGPAKTTPNTALARYIAGVNPLTRGQKLKTGQGFREKRQLGRANLQSCQPKASGQWGPGGAGVGLGRGFSWQCTRLAPKRLL